MTLNSPTRSPLRADHARELSNIGKRAAPVLGARRVREHRKRLSGSGHVAVANLSARLGLHLGRIGSTCRRARRASSRNIRMHAGEVLAV